MEDQKTSSFLDRVDVVLIATVAFVCVSVASRIIWENGDVQNKWFVIKAWAELEFPGFPVNHHNLRWGINVPAAGWVAVVGDRPSSYLVLNYLIFSVSTAILFYLVREVANFWIAATACLVWLVMPSTYFMAPNLMPELYSVFYVGLALVFIGLSVRHDSLWLYAIAVIAMFAAYGAKETSVFFYPGLLLFELWRRRLDRVVVLIVVSAALLLTETVVLDVVLSGLEITLGRLEAILLGRHVTGMEEVFGFYTPVDLIRRWWFLNPTEYVSKVIYILFFISIVYLLVIERRQKGQHGDCRRLAGTTKQELSFAAGFLGLSYIFFNTFFIISIDPLVFGQPLNDRYLWPLLVPAFICCARVAGLFWERRSARRERGGAKTGVADIRRGGISRRWNIPALVLIAVIASGTRLAFDHAIVEFSRNGVAQPYNVVTVDRYFASVRDRFDRGCTMVFPSPRAAWSTLMFAYPFDSFDEPEDFYNRSAKGMGVLDGATLTAISIAPEDAAQLHAELPGRLHVVDGPEGPARELFVVRLGRADGSQPACPDMFFLGYADIPEAQQALP